MIHPFATSSKQKIPWARAILASLAIMSGTVQADIQPFKAEYGVQYLRVRAADVSLTLKQIDAENWYMHRRSRAVGVARLLVGEKLKLDEQSWFGLNENQPAPTKFVLDKPGDKRGRRRIEINFSETEAVVSTDDGKKNSFQTEVGSQDQVTAVLAVMMAMEEQQQNFKLTIMGRKGENLASFEVMERTTMKSPAGKFRTVHIIQKTKKRTTDYWLALDHHMVPVKIVHKEKDQEGVQMLLEKIAFQPVKASAILTKQSD